MIKSWSLDNGYKNHCGSINLKELSSDDNENPTLDLQSQRRLILSKLSDSLYDYKHTIRYYFIPHVDTDTYHIHYLICCDCQTRLSTTLNYLSKQLDINATAINIQPCDSIISYVKYMAHQSKNSKEDGKKEYSALDIISNDSLEVIDSYVNSKTGQLDADALIDIVLNSKNELDLMQTLGLQIYHKYRYEIDVILRDKGYYKALRDEQRLKDVETPF